MLFKRNRKAQKNQINNINIVVESQPTVKYSIKEILNADICDRMGYCRRLDVCYGKKEYINALADAINLIHNKIPYIQDDEELITASISLDTLIDYRTELMMRHLSSKHTHNQIACAEEYVVSIL